MRSPGRRPRTLLALVASGVFVTACGADDATDAAAGSSGVASPGGAETGTPDLASGLLPADAFGPDAAVVPITRDRLQQGAGVAAAGAEDLQITPAECAAAVEGTQPQFDEFGDLAAQSATSGSTTTVEVLVRGGPTKGTADLLARAAERCPRAQATAPQFGQAAITFESLPAEDLGDGAAVLRYTTAVSLPDGTQATIPTLIGAVEDDDRLVVLMSLGTSALGGEGAADGATPVDAAEFTELLAQAYRAQAEALG